jgi:hypothetical protein
MSPRREICRGTGKVKYKTRDKANRAARRLLRDRGLVQYPYQCPSCGSWHLTSSRQRGLTDPEPDMSLAEAERLAADFLHVSLTELRAMPRMELFRLLVGEDGS